MTTPEPGPGRPATGPRPLRAVPEPRGPAPVPVGRAAPSAPVGQGPAVIPPRALSLQGARAGLVSRVLANGVDAAIVLALLAGGYLGLVAVRFVLSPSTFSFPDLSVVFAVAGFIAVQVGYFTVSWAMTGRTYGDHVMGLRVVSFRGRRMRWAGAFVRALACAFFPIGLLWVAVSRENRSLQDVVIRTSVVYDWRESSPSA